MIKLYKKELHEKQLQDYFFENPEEGLKLGLRGTFTEDDGIYWDLKLVYELDNKVVGVLIADSCSVQRKVELNQIGVFKDHKKKGIGKKLFDYMENYYRRLEMTHIKVMHFSDNNVGDFYKKMGFEENFVAKYGTVRFGKWLKNINLIKFLL